MILGQKREQVIRNIRRAAESGSFYSKVEIDDPVLTEEQKKTILETYFSKKKTWRWQVNNRIARFAVNTASKKLNTETIMNGLEHLSGVTGGAIVTSNHFNPLDNTLLRTLALKTGKNKLCIASEETNLAMSGWIGYLMNYADTVPVSSNLNYMGDKFDPMLEGLLKQENWILIYPEQEMWFNYRKPRPLKRGAYYYAAKYRVPVISCFAEIHDLEQLDTPEFHKVRYTLHVLPTIFPDPAKGIRENSIAMCQQDYRQKTAAYEAAYGKLLTYHFEPSDIAGWIPSPI
ncbi:MAG TPA: lysophospholipid acyltransferase family protein [Clostridia bacterium]|nr:lysophospholipid acyltransferase family protein [Clostridia bacterium]